MLDECAYYGHTTVMETIEAGQAVRTERAKLIATTKRIAKRGPLWVVPSQSHKGHYVVTNSQVHGMPRWECSCPDYATRGQPCKHIIAIEIVRHHELPDGSVVTETTRVTYAQNWPAYNAAQVHEKERFRLLLADLCSGLATEPRKGAGRPRMPLSDVVYGNALKVYSTQSGRRASTDVREAHDHGLLTKFPSYNTLFRYMESPDLTPVLTLLIEHTARPLRGVETCFAVDSTGFANATYVRWFDEKWGGERSMKTWVKTHAMVGVSTNIVTAVKVTPMAGADCPEFKDLVTSTAKRFAVSEVSADRAYLSHDNVELVDALGADAFIPFKEGTGRGIVLSDGSMVKNPKLWEKLFHRFQYDREKFLKHYHLRSNVETTFHMIKSKFGAAIRSKSPTAQINEALMKVLCHNLVVNVGAIYELGLEPVLGGLEGAA